MSGTVAEPVSAVIADVQAPAVAPASAPPVVAPAPAPVAVASVPDAAPALVPAPVAPAEAPTLLGAPPVVAPVEPVVAPAPVVVAQTAEPAPLPTYEPFVLPEGVTLDPERVGSFTGMLAEFEGNTKAEHAAVQALGQRMVEQHVAELQRVVESIRVQSVNAAAAQAEAWKAATVADPEIGGARLDATVEAARQFLSTHGGTPEQQNEIRAVLQETKLGNHPALVRLFAKANLAMSEGRPLAAARPVVPVSNLQKFYGTSA